MTYVKEQFHQIIKLLQLLIGQMLFTKLIVHRIRQHLNLPMVI